MHATDATHTTNRMEKKKLVKYKINYIYLLDMKTAVPFKKYEYCNALQYGAGTIW